MITFIIFGKFLAIISSNIFSSPLEFRLKASLNPHHSDGFRKTMVFVVYLCCFGC